MESCAQIGYPDSFSNYMNDELLKYAVENGMIDLSYVQEQIEMKKRKELLEKHPYKIWEGNDGKWRTYLPDDSKNDGRRMIKRTTEDAVNRVIMDYYKSREEEQIVTFKYAYDRWLEMHSAAFTSDNTLIKYRTDYERFFKGRDMENMDINLFNEENLEQFIISLCKELKLAPKACKTLCGYMRNTFKSAKIHKDIEYNPFDNLETKHFYQYCVKKVKTPEQRTISNKEFKLLYEQFYLDYQKQPNYIPTYAVEFASLTGFRVGEISALMWTDVKDGMIVVNKSEKYNRDTKEYWIGPTKNGKERYMPLTDEIVKLLVRLQKVQKEYKYESEFIFSNENGRIHAPVISSCAKNKCKQIGIPYKSIHAYRRTFSSKLKCNGVSSTVVASLMGHTEEVNEQYYTYDITEMQDKQTMVSMVTKEIINAQKEKETNTILIGQKVIKGNQNNCLSLSRKPL